MNMKSILETDRLILQPISPDDAPFMFELFNAPKWLTFIGDRNIRTPEDAQAYIAKKMMYLIEDRFPSNYLLIQKDTNLKTGLCGLYDRTGIDGVDLGFALLPDYEGKGLAFEAANHLLHAVFNEMGLPRLSAITLPENSASKKLLERLGFEFVETVQLAEDAERVELYFLSASSFTKKEA